MKNRKMKKKLSMMLALILLFALAGCSSGKEAEDVSEAAPETGAEAETPKEQEPAGEAKDLSSLTIGLANINERGVFGKLVKQGFEGPAPSGAGSWNMRTTIPTDRRQFPTRKHWLCGAWILWWI